MTYKTQPVAGIFTDCVIKESIDLHLHSIPKTLLTRRSETPATSKKSWFFIFKLLVPLKIISPVVV